MYSNEITNQLLNRLNAWDANYLGDWEDVIDQFVETADTVDDIRNNAYYYKNDHDSYQGDGLTILENHQYFKGDARKTLFIIDLGEKRYVYGY